MLALFNSTNIFYMAAGFGGIACLICLVLGIIDLARDGLTLRSVCELLAALAFFLEFGLGLWGLEKSKQEYESDSKEESNRWAQADAKITNNAPLNQPVSEVSAIVSVVLDTTNGIESGTDWNNSTQALLSTGIGNGANTSSGEFEELVSDKITPFRANGQQAFLIAFHTHIGLLFPDLKYPRLTVSEALRRISSPRLDLLFVPASNGVLSGKIEVVINGSNPKKFSISPQPGFTNSQTRSGLFIIASNVLEETTLPVGK